VITDAITCGLLLFGALFTVTAAVGVVRFPDVFTRMHAASKSGTLGVISLAVALGLHFGSADIAIQAMLISLFLLLTAPIGSHIAARAAYLSGIRPCRESVIDTLGDQLDGRTSSSPPADHSPEGPTDTNSEDGAIIPSDQPLPEKPRG